MKLMQQVGLSRIKVLVTNMNDGQRYISHALLTNFALGLTGQVTQSHLVADGQGRLKLTIFSVFPLMISSIFGLSAFPY